MPSESTPQNWHRCAQRISDRGIGFARRTTFTTIATEGPVVGDGAILHDQQTIGDINAASFAFTSFASIAAASDFGEIIAAVGPRDADLARWYLSWAPGNR